VEKMDAEEIKKYIFVFGDKGSSSTGENIWIPTVLENILLKRRLDKLKKHIFGKIIQN
jgi:hypothetical protein